MALPKELSTIKRFGARYGRTTRHKFGLIENVQKQLHKCPYCAKQRVKRVAMGIWQCRKCNAQFTGKAYTIAKKKVTAKELMAQISVHETVEVPTETDSSDQEEASEQQA